MRASLQMIYSKLNKKFLLSYITVFLFPFLILSGILIWQVVSQTKLKIESTNNEGLTQVYASLEEHFKKLNTISLDMSINPSVSKKVELQPLEAMAYEEELQRYVLFSDIAEDIYITYDNQEKVFSNVGTMEISTLLSQRLKNQGIDSLAFRKNLVSEEPVLAAFASEPQNLYYFVPFVFSGVKIGKIVFAIPTTGLSQRVLVPFQKPEQNYLMTLNQQTISTTFNESETVSSAYFSQSKTVADVGLQIESLVPEAVFNREVWKVVLLVIACLLILFLSGIGVVIYYGHRQYEPVYRLNRLYRYIAKCNQTEEKEIQFDEVGDFLFQQSILVDATKKEIQQIRDESFWKQILKGDLPDLGAIQKELKLIGKKIDLEHAYLLGITSTDFSKKADINLQTKSLLTNLFPYTDVMYQAECIELTHLKQFVFIIELNSSEKTESSLEEGKEDFRQVLNKELNTTLSLTFSNQATKIEGLNLNYISLMAQIEHQQELNQSATLDQNSHFAYPEQAVLTLKQAIKVGSSAAIEKIIADIVQNEKSMQISFFMRQSYYHYVLRQLLLMKEEAQLSGDFYYQNATIELATIEKELSLVALELSNGFAKEVAAYEKAVDQEILQTIHENFMRPSFSLEELAIKFGVSLSKMSIMVKNEAKVSFSKYVQALRIERVKQELLETSKPVKEIITDVGYHDIANFTRKFREEVGVPPGQFRKIFEKKTDQMEVSP
ncbi:helix-turn-helix domain-containing protein [Enterococcus sp. LJL120]